MRCNRLLPHPGLALLWSAACVLGAAAPASAQIQNGNLWPHPRLTVLTPAGGKAGTTVDVAFGGSETDEPQALVFSHPGLKGEPIIPPPPKVDPKAKPDPNAKAPPITKFNVTIAKDVPVGFYDVRLVNKYGVSNPRVFVVGDLAEVAEKEPNNEDAQAQRVELGTTISGGIGAPTDVDYTIFPGKKGQRVLIHCLAATMDSRLNPEITLYDAASRQIGYERAQPGEDGLLDVTLPADGDYLVRLNHFTYTGGGPEFFYRLSLSTGPWVDAIVPPMVQPGKPAQVTLYGRNLPGGKPDPAAVLDGQVLDKLTITVNAPAAADQLGLLGRIPSMGVWLDGFEYRYSGPTGTANPRLLTFATAPVILENDDNDTPERAQQVPVPCEIAGRIDKKRDRDWYRFDAKKGEVLMIEVFSQRLGAPTDMYFSLRNLATKQEIALVDDLPENLSPSPRLYVQHRDPVYRFVAPADGTYHLLAVSHTGENHVDPTHIYRVRIAPEKPDFRLVVMPADDHRPDAVAVGQGGTYHYTVFAERHDGFKGDITLTMEGLPAGVTCPAQVLAHSVRYTHLVVSAADGAAPFTGPVKVIGTATHNGQKLVHQARPATITWPTQPQQNIPTITRLDRELMLAVREKAPGMLAAGKDKVAISLGDKTEVPLKLQRYSPEFKSNLTIGPVPNELPQGFTFGNVTLTPGKDEQNATVTVAANVPPGKYNLVFRGFAPIAPPSAKGKPVNTILNSTPVEVTVLPKQVANLSVDNGNLNIKAGGEAALAVRVARLFDYADAFKVELVLPPNTKGISADGITIPPGAGEAKLTLRVPAGTAPANLQNLVVRATAVVNGNVTLTHETKINVNITK